MSMEKFRKPPFFMPVATKGSVKYMNSQFLAKVGVECIICNSLIFSWSPGVEVVKRAGGLHSFINWNGGIFTDSGGSRAWISKYCKIPDGVKATIHI